MEIYGVSTASYGKKSVLNVQKVRLRYFFAYLLVSTPSIFKSVDFTIHGAVDALLVSKGLRYKDYRPDAFYPADFEDRTPP
ncbi:hypothetical protein TREVI0001_0535 [Treponema vincentii ATCC 35580]|uniref:Uncharacterized protein n=1 Tax=Treponema vincentii ATCC 35580 TaxID=596324 RepID=C8PMC1_9SPIR|nr:hypothetical protein TREVI0001_0535 [Treponema vincentii ATCC 35580]